MQQGVRYRKQRVVLLTCSRSGMRAPGRIEIHRRFNRGKEAIVHIGGRLRDARKLGVRKRPTSSGAFVSS